MCSMYNVVLCVVRGDGGIGTRHSRVLLQAGSSPGGLCCPAQGQGAG